MLKVVLGSYYYKHRIKTRIGESFGESEKLMGRRILGYALIVEIVALQNEDEHTGMGEGLIPAPVVSQ